MSSRKRLALIGGGIPLGLLLFVVAAWGIDTAVSGDRVVRNVIVADQPLGGLGRADIEAVASNLTAELGAEPVTVQLGTTSLESDPITLGVRVDGPELADRALQARRGGFFLTRPFKWVGTFFSNDEIDVPYTVDTAAAEAATTEFITNDLADPVEPQLEVSDGELVVVPGSAGATLAPGAIAAGLPAMMAAGQPYVISLTPDPLPPETDDAVLEAVASEANEATSRPITVQVLTSTATVEPAEMRSWVSLDLSSGEPTWVIDSDAAVTDLQPLFPLLGSPDQRARFDIVDNKPVIIPASASVVCCSPDTGEQLKEQLLAAQADPGSDAPVVTLDARETSADDGVAELESLGIIEEVGSFTTKYPCCQSRVTNIHLIADIVRGAIILPGEQLSLNQYVGKRDTARGFVAAGAIASGVLEDQIGGGVSQFATTIFNAAFFSGLDIPVYQSHSLYFSRYPRGREATISWPNPDLVLANNTPYGVLIWTSYTDTTITVTMYSTKTMTVEDVGSVDTPQNQCTRVTTTRKRTYLDGTEKLDKFFAVYRPAEGFNCAGESTTPTTEPPTTEPPTTAPPTTAPPTTAPPTTAPPTTAPPTTAGTP